MAKTKRRAAKRTIARKKKIVARRKPAARHKAVKRQTAPAAMAPRPVVIPGAWPFPMGSKS